MKLDSGRWSIFGIGALVSLASVAVHVVAQPTEQVIQVTARRFDYTPGEIRIRRGVPVVIEFTTQDVAMGFSAPDLDTRADIVPGKVTRVRLVPNRIGTFDFHCDIFCGSGHEEMAGTIIVTD
jgi:cytochrome c oxidase subunit 2